MRPATVSLILVLVTLAFFSCEEPLADTDDPVEPEANPPNAPSIMRSEPIETEPRRGIILWIYDDSDDEDGFILERKSHNQSFHQIADLRANTDEYIDWGLEVSTAYTYRINAFNEIGRSDWSREDTETTVGPQSNLIWTYTTADAAVKEVNPSNNYGGNNTMTIAGYSGAKENALVLFSLPNLPSYSTGMRSSTLRLCEAGGGNTIYPGRIFLFAAPILSSWDEYSVTWNNRPGTWLSTNGTSWHDPNSDPCAGIDVSNVVSDWYSGIRVNYGFNLFSGTEAYCLYYSREGYQPGSALLYIEYWW